jgi:starch-binding outer membrane protein, SusD/RagB family
MKNTKHFFLILLLGLSTSCYQDDFLKDELLANNSVEFLYSSPQGIANAVVGLYALNREPYQRDWFNGAVPLILQAKSDLSAGIDGEISLFSNCFWGCGIDEDYGTEAAYGYFWGHNYRIIDITNNIISGGELLLAEGSTDASLIKNLAEAKTFRAHAYFTLYRLFKNIYIKTEPTTPATAFERPQSNSPKEEIFSLIREDLNFASENLSYTTDEFGRWTKAAVDHVRAKVELWDQNYSKAAEIADDIIANSPHALVNVNQVFQDDLQHSETLFAVNFKRNAIGGGAWHQLNWQTVAHYSAVPGLVQSLENGGDGFGFITLNPYVVNLLNSNTNDQRIGNYYIFNYRYNDEKTLPTGKNIGDPLDVYSNVAEDDDFFMYFKRQSPGVIKFFDDTVEPTDRMHFKNIMVYRLAETYLMGAEAHLENGNSSKAQEYLNAVRVRAGISPVSSPTLEHILEERARELAFEGQRWYSLKRRGLLFDYLMDHMNADLLNEYYARNHVNPKEVYQPHMVNLPIPQGVLDLLGASYPQNEGYY